MDAQKVKELQLFVERCKKNPAILSDPSIAFFRDYLESLGAKLPHDAYKPGESPRTRDEAFKVQGRDKRGRRIPRIIGKFFPARELS